MPENQLKEFELIKEIKQNFPDTKKIFKGIGDDCAVVREGKNYLLYTIDNMVEGVHFDISLGMDYESIGYKSIIRAISDIIAMGGKPKFFLLNLLLPGGIKKFEFDSLLIGVKKACLKYKLFLIGGDISRSKNLIISVSAIGKISHKPILRDGAKVGDYIYYTGNPGMASLGLELMKLKVKDIKAKPYIKKFLKPEVRSSLATILSKHRLATAMIDISDGFLGDLTQILKNSKCGALIYQDFTENKLFYDLKKFFNEKEIKKHILNGGDEYELIFTGKKENKEKIQEIGKKLKIKIGIAGEIIKSGLFLQKDSKKIPISPLSYEHRF